MFQYQKIGGTRWNTKEQGQEREKARVRQEYIHNDQGAIEREDILTAMVENLSEFIKLKFPMSGKGGK